MGYLTSERFSPASLDASRRCFCQNLIEAYDLKKSNIQQIRHSVTACHWIICPMFNEQILGVLPVTWLLPP